MDRVGEPGDAAREGARLVEDVVVGELLLGHEAPHEPSVDERRRVVEVGPAGDGDPDREGRAEALGARGEAVELDHLRVDERTPLHEVFGGIAADELLGEEHHGRAVFGRRGGDGDRAVDVAAERADRRVHARGRDANEPHGPSAAFRRGW